MGAGYKMDTLELLDRIAPENGKRRRVVEKKKFLKIFGG